MPNVQITTQVSTDELLHSVERLPTQELDQFVSKVLAIRAKLKAPSLSAKEVGLMARINAHPTEAEQQRWNELEEKRRAETLNPSEQQELISLNEGMENQNVDRVTALAELAQLRQMSLPDLMKQIE